MNLDREALADFCRKWRIRELSLFGSALRDDFRPDSDLDFLVSFEPEARWNLFDLVAGKWTSWTCEAWSVLKERGIQIFMSKTASFRGLSNWKKLEVLGSLFSVLGVAVYFIWPSAKKVSHDNNQASQAGIVQAPKNSPGSIVQNIKDSPNSVQIAVKGDLNINKYYPLSVELRTKIRQSLSQFKGCGFEVIIKVESGNSLRQKVAEDLGDILSSVGIGFFPRGNTCIGNAPDHPITIWCAKKQLSEVNAFVESIAPYIKEGIFVDASDSEATLPVQLYINGTPLFFPDGSVIIQ